MRRGLLETVGALSLALAAGYLVPAGARPPDPPAGADAGEDYADVHRRVHRPTRSVVIRAEDAANPSSLAGSGVTAGDPAVEENAVAAEIADVRDFDLADLAVGVSGGSEVVRDESEAGIGDGANRDLGRGRGDDEAIVEAGWTATISADKESKGASRAISLAANDTQSNNRRVARIEDSGDDDRGDDAGGGHKSGSAQGSGKSKGSSDSGTRSSGTGHSGGGSKSSGSSSKGNSGSGGKSGSGDGGRSSGSGSGGDGGSGGDD